MNVRGMTAAMAAVFLGTMGLVQLAAEPPQKPSGPVAEESAKDVAVGYKKLTLMTPKPVAVNPGLFSGGGGTGCGQNTDGTETYGPHSKTTINVYMNNAAAAAFKKGEKAYPVGAVVVKEKDNGALGGMVKRSPGYDADHGDWEFFYIEKGGKLESGKMTDCVQCHNAVAERDHVYGDWAPKAEK